MKKILSFVLVLAMIASMMCVSVSAAAETIVGSGTGNNKTGVDKFDPTSNSGEVKATLSANVNNRYAVELEYSVSSIIISGDATWNVNTLVYDSNLKYKTDYMNAEADLNNQVQTVQVADFAVTNYSDLGVTVKIEANIDNIEEAEAKINCDISKSTDNIDGAYDEGEDSDHTNLAKKGEYTVSLSCSDWARAFAQLKNKFGSTTFTLASLTISVAPQNSAHLKTPAQGTN